MSVAQKNAPARWVLAPEPEAALVDELVEETGLRREIVKILVNRQLSTPQLIESFLDPKLSDLRDPFLMAGMECGIDRTARALVENEHIMIYGDYDVDGVTATTLLYMVLNKLGAKVSFHLPNRLTHGYGLSEETLNVAQKDGVGLIITVDTGITAVDEIEYANKLSQLLKDTHHIVYPSTKGLVNFAKIIQLCELFIGGSTGPLHIAGALNRPTAAFYQRRRSATPLRWQTLNSEERRLAFTPPEDEHESDMQKINILEAANKINDKFLKN